VTHSAGTRIGTVDGGYPARPGSLSPLAVRLLLKPRSLKTKPGLRRYLRRTAGGLLRVDAAAIKHESPESHLDGKWLLRTPDPTLDPTLTPEDLAAAYKQLLAVERGRRDIAT
jgi:hypothetical protein